MTPKTSIAAKDQKIRRPSDGSAQRGRTRPRSNPIDLTRHVLAEELFLGMLCLERKRAERSGSKFALVLIDARGVTKQQDRTSVFERIFRAVAATRRETDIVGWYEANEILGVIFTELGEFAESAVSEMLRSKIAQGLAAELTEEELQSVHVSLHVFDDDSDDRGSNQSNPAFYPDIFHQTHTKKFSFALKRVMDCVGAAAAITLLSPVFALIALAIKLTSNGPVLFRQQRIGQFGVPFEFLKFRSMHASNSPEVHKAFVRNFISGKTEANGPNLCGKPVFKITNDARVTPVGRFLRRTSLDELPQFWNVLRGEMSLVGPRPPVVYEVEAYYIWHRRRVLEAKPGITGLWQVHGRSKTTFDEMVRLDLQYAKKWSPLLDIKILLQTPRVVLFGDGAY